MSASCSAWYVQKGMRQIYIEVDLSTIFLTPHYSNLESINCLPILTIRYKTAVKVHKFIIRSLTYCQVITLMLFNGRSYFNIKLHINNGMIYAY